MFQLIEFFKKRPSDKTIRIGRIIFGLLILLLLGIYFNDYNLNLPESIKPYEFYIKCFLLIYGILPILTGIFNFCIAKMKYVRILQIVVGILLIIIGNNIDIKTQTIIQPIETATGSTSFEDITKTTETKKPIEVGFWIALLGIIPIIVGISGKGITSKCLKYGETITKIRV